jgi:hypothetical protein
MPKVSADYNLEVVNPDLAAEWHPQKNGDLTPQAVTPGSGRKVWWQCEQGHEWQAAVYQRSRGSGCPHCYRASIKQGNPLVDSHLMMEWHPTLNAGLNPRTLSAAFNRKIWWLCRDGHEWKATLRSRLKGEGCPNCGSKQPDSDTGFSQEVGRDLLQTEIDFRRAVRHPYHASVIIENPQRGQIAYAMIKDYSTGGMHIEADAPLQTGSRVIVRLKKPIKAFTPEQYFSHVRWCRDLFDADDNHLGYSIGLQFI